MNIETIKHKIQTTQQRVEILSRNTSQLLLQPELLSVVLEELSIALEELHTQYEELLATRLRDITEHKRAEAEMQKALAKEKELSELKIRFIQTVSHEYRTPLSIILLSAGVIESCILPKHEEKKQRNCQRIKAAVKHMTELLEQVLVFNQAETGEQEFNPTILDLEQFCRNLIEEHQDLAGTKHKIQFTSRGKCHSAYLDTKLLGQILGNLLSNALKYSSEGNAVRFELTCEDNKAIFQIRDQGIGIPKEDQSRLFEPFHRATNVGTLPGTGLGLTIVKKAVDLHGGAIAFESEVGIGTTFTVILPLKR
ncbi:MAG: sensor histidine kinase [Xenococcaceae cyanobacterium]